MNKEEIRRYLKDNLKLGIIWDDCHYYICLKLDDEIISKIKFEGV